MVFGLSSFGILSGQVTFVRVLDRYPDTQSQYSVQRSMFVLTGSSFLSKPRARCIMAVADDSGLNNSRVCSKVKLGSSCHLLSSLNLFSNICLAKISGI